jgi:cell division protein FtsL
MVKIILNLILILIYNYAIFYCLFPQVRSYGIQIDDLNKQIKNLNKQIKNLNEQIKKQNIKDDIKVIEKD